MTLIVMKQQIEHKGSKKIMDYVHKRGGVGFMPTPLFSFFLILLMSKIYLKIGKE